MRVAVLRGGPSREREVSMWSGAEVLKSLGASGVDVVVGEAGTWTVAGRERASFADASAALRGFDAAFIALHGAFGEDGTVQALLESIGLPYTGSRPAASALAMDKIRTKLVYRGAGLPTAPSVDRLAGDDVEGVLRRVAADLLGPWVVKPASEGSSFGVSFCDDEAELRAALDGLGAAEGLVEARVAGRELTCAVLDGPDGLPAPLPVTELIPKGEHRFFTFEAKYTPGETKEVTPAEIDDALRDRLQALALSAHRQLGCRHLSRTDFMFDGEAIFLLETNTVPGMTRTSLVPQAAAAAGLDFDELVARLIERAVSSSGS